MSSAAHLAAGRTALRLDDVSISVATAPTRASIQTRATGRPGPLLLWSMRLALAAATLAIYWNSLRTDFVGDDWMFLALAHDHSFLWNLTPLGGYHYDPVLGVIFFATYHLFGLNPIPYHLLAYAIFWTAAILVMQLGWKLSGHLSVGCLAGLLFVAVGSQYEAAIWGLVAYAAGVSTVLFLAGLLLFITSQNPQFTSRQRRLSYVGFMVALVLGPFVYEQSITLIGACILYRALVIEAGMSFKPGALVHRARAWLRTFALPAVFFLAYLGLKVWLARQTPVSQLPGLATGWRNLTLMATVGLLQAFLPGASVTGLYTYSFVWITPLGYLLDTFIEVLLLALLFIKFTPVARFLLLITAMLVVTQIVSLGNIASRHLFLITAPTAILWAMLLVTLPGWLMAWLARRGGADARAGRLIYAPSVALALLLIFAGVRFAVREQRYWAAAVTHVDALMSQVQRFSDADPGANALYLIDLPDSVLAPTGETMYEFRNSSHALVAFTMPNRFSTVNTVCTDASGYPNWTCNTYATEDEILSWSQDRHALVLRYDPATGRLAHLTV